MAAIQPAKILSQRTYQAAGKLSITEHVFAVPKDYKNPAAGSIQLFARSARKRDTAVVPETSHESQQLPWMIFLQGGPGFPCRSPQLAPYTNFVLEKGYQLLHIDSRGTGLSTPISASTLQMRGDTSVQANYLKLHRAPNIAADCESIRLALTADYPPEKQQWSAMGQSFGGFTIISYLSFFPQGLREAFLFGGLQPLVSQPDQVYKNTYPRVLARNLAYYHKYPEDVARVKRIVSFLTRFDSQGVHLPSGGRMTPARFQALGIDFGFNRGLDTIHDLILRCDTDITLFGHLTRGCLAELEARSSFDENPIYAFLHEPIYSQGPGSAPKWSAERTRPVEFSLDVKKADDEPFLFTGEMVYPSMFTSGAYPELSKLADVAENIAQDDDWEPLFDVEQLKRNKVPVYAASYMDDMYVDFELGTETAKTIRGCKTFVTNGMFHGALRNDTDEVLRKLWALKEDCWLD